MVVCKVGVNKNLAFCDSNYKFAMNITPLLHIRISSDYGV